MYGDLSAVNHHVQQAVLCALLYMMIDSGEVAIHSISEIRSRSDNGKEISTCGTWIDGAERVGMIMT